MRVPVLSTDLPEKFNKVAKYIGRHWPNDKLGLNKSRETLAYLFGYNSVHEVNQVASSNTLPETMPLNLVYSSMVGKALYKYGVRPDTLSHLLYKTPFKELAFYAVTDIEQERVRMEELRKSTGKIIFHDEYQSFANYKSPSLIVEQNKENLLPPYQYAVNKNAEIFCSSTYESILNSLGDIESLVSDLDIETSVVEFIKQHILPLAWLPINDFLINQHCKERSSWQTPYMINIHHIKQDDNVLGYAISHKGLGAFYPVICDSVESVNEVLSKLYKGELITPDDKLIGTFETTSSFRPELGSHEYWSNVTFDDKAQLTINGQLLVRAEELKPYTALKESKILNAYQWSASSETNIIKNTISQEVYSDHLCIKQSRVQVLQSAIESLSQVKTEEIKSIIESVFAGEVISLKSIIANEYDEDCELDDSDALKWANIGTEALKLHPELAGVIDISAIGYLYCDYENYVRGDRYAWHCEKRDVAFIGYTLCQSKRIKGSRVQSEDDAFTGALILNAYTGKNALNDLDKLPENYANIIALLSLHYKQDSRINDIEKYSLHLNNQNPDYISHGEEAHYSEKSSSELTNDAMKLGRKWNAKPVLVEQSLEDLKSKG